MAYYSTHGISQFLLNNEKQRVRFLLAHPVYITIRLAVWLSDGNALASINVVALRQTRLVPGWVTVCGRVNHLGI